MKPRIQKPGPTSGLKESLAFFIFLSLLFSGWLLHSSYYFACLGYQAWVSRTPDDNYPCPCTSCYHLHTCRVINNTKLMTKLTHARRHRATNWNRSEKYTTVVSPLPECRRILFKSRNGQKTRGIATAKAGKIASTIEPSVKQINITTSTTRHITTASLCLTKQTNKKKVNLSPSVWYKFLLPSVPVVFRSRRNHWTDPRSSRLTAK